MALGYVLVQMFIRHPLHRLAAILAMPQGEGVIVNGAGSQTGSSRWGDYTSMNVDPTDDCTFWYVNQWVPATSAAGWQLRD
jgi:hypothetical protein